VKFENYTDLSIVLKKDSIA